MIYLDNNATTAIAPEVFDAMKPFLTASFGNPSSAHTLGREGRQAIEKARESVAGLIGAASAAEIIFTSGGTESDNWAILGALEANAGKKHIVTSRIEHEAVRKLCEKLESEGCKVTWLDVDTNGELDLDQLRSVITPETAVVSLMLANNETGILFPVTEIADIIKERSNANFHVDAVNAAGKMPIDVKNSQIDLLSISAHKFHGPKGVGALYKRQNTAISPIFSGGGQENGMRPGTEAVHQIAALGAAADLVTDLTPMESIRILRDMLEQEILTTIPNSRLNGTNEAAKRLPNTSNISFENTNGEGILAKLNDLGICVSTGSACNSASHTASPVLEAMDIPYSYAMGSIRFSLGRFTTAEEVGTVLSFMPEVVADLRAMSG